MPQIRKKHPLAIRWLHWLNFPLLSLMVWSGTLIYWANDTYKIGFGSKTIFKFYPDAVYKALKIPFRLAEGMAWHFAFMWFFAINGLIYVLYTAISGEWRLLVPGRNALKEAWQVLLHDLYLSKKEPPERKFNGAQQIAYTGVIIMGFFSLITGLAIYKPAQFGFITALLGGYEYARVEHFALTIGYMLFFLIHIMQVIRAGWNNFRAMVTGFEEIKKHENE